MAQFLITYHGMGHPTPEAMAAGRAAFQAWVESIGDAVIDPGAPVNVVGQIASGDAAPEALLSSHPFIARGGTLQISECLGI
ncbi:hypothetical protein ACQCSX_01860 [Pseudarthrobacter sp. P1]|uniref:hypothetical protein n=1 Tax=Pseudarthrobacter sp. P1 TaxID=3418418 RepID=UPI003CEA3DF5